MTQTNDELKVEVIKGEKLPSISLNVKRPRITSVLSFCYGLSETDIKVLSTLTKTEMMRTEDLVRELSISKAGVNKSLNKLLAVGLVMRIKETGNRVGRPRYQYKAVKNLKEKILKDIRDCVTNIEKLVEQELEKLN